MCLYIFHLLISYLGQLYHWCPNCVLPHLMVLGVQFRTLYMEDKHSKAELHIQLNSKVICYKVQAPRSISPLAPSPSACNVSLASP